MALEKLDNALLSARIACSCFCVLALLMFFGNGHVIFDRVTKVSMAALVTQIVLGLLEMMCFDVAAPLPNSLRSSLLIVLVDSLCAFFLMGIGLGGVGISIQKSYNHVCFSECKVSLVYSIIVTLSGALARLATLFNIAVASKMNLQRNLAQRLAGKHGQPGQECVVTGLLSS